MAKKYKVWVEIEEADDENDSYENASPFPVCAGEFRSLVEADQFIIKLTGDSTLQPFCMSKFSIN
jgi:hypothetical protein